MSETTFPPVSEHPFGTAEYKKDFVAIVGFPYGAELTYKHRFWWDKDYQAAFWRWMEDGMPGEPEEFLFGWKEGEA